MEIIKKIATGILDFLPDNPFTTAFDELQSGLSWWGYVNYFVPVKAILAIASGWALCMASYYAWNIVSKWIEKAVK